eukprot:CAMPEP_0113669346 /NCGR_PEP_ID=MMETSP0038_2-20120614/4521_1 /TAXON_ID=2898 /ORGANISM="Cryptomonas paramecium" /LENGTH=66 /DNA_ID=CAMNT_0000585223 /DNA_START=61 /DNA_END=261 /DNA_ORIENTATION=- /assembly_acc=CAM_ASM_000170
MFNYLRPRYISVLDMLGARYSDNVNDGIDGNNSNTDDFGPQNTRFVGNDSYSAATNDDMKDGVGYI